MLIEVGGARELVATPSTPDQGQARPLLAEQEHGGNTFRPQGEAAPSHPPMTLAG